MPIETAEKIVDFVFRRTPKNEEIDIGFFGGEPLLAFDFVRAVTQRVERHDGYDPGRVSLSIVTNGTIYNDEIGDFLAEHDFAFGISCDGPPFVQDRYRRHRNGRPSSTKVEANLKRALKRNPGVMVNAVYRPDTLAHLPQVVDYFAMLGCRQIYLNADFSAPWTAQDAAKLPAIFDAIVERYVAHYVSGRPIYISPIDAKITAILRGGYRPLERCRMGKGELAFAANGNIFPCERLIGSGDASDLCIGHIDRGIEPRRMASCTAPSQNSACQSCGVRDYCVNWCGCSNYFSTGYYNRTGAFLCASERAAIAAARDALLEAERRVGTVFSDHLAGEPAANAVST